MRGCEPCPTLKGLSKIQSEHLPNPVAFPMLSANLLVPSTNQKNAFLPRSKFCNFIGGRPTVEIENSSGWIRTHHSVETRQNSCLNNSESDVILAHRKPEGE